MNEIQKIIGYAENNINQIATRMKESGFSSEEVNEFLGLSLSKAIDEEDFKKHLSAVRAKLVNDFGASVVERFVAFRTVITDERIKIPINRNNPTNEKSISYANHEGFIVTNNNQILNGEEKEQITKWISGFLNKKYSIELHALFDKTNFNKHVLLIKSWVEPIQIGRFMKKAIYTADFNKLISSIKIAVRLVLKEKTKDKVREFVEFLARLRSDFMQMKVDYQMPYIKKSCDNQKTIQPTMGDRLKLLRDKMLSSIHTFGSGLEEYHLRKLKFHMSKIGNIFMQDFGFSEKQTREYFLMIVNRDTKLDVFNKFLLNLYGLCKNKNLEHIFHSLESRICIIRSSVTFKPVNSIDIDNKYGVYFHDLDDVKESLKNESVISNRLYKYTKQLFPNGLDKFSAFLIGWMRKFEEYVGIEMTPESIFSKTVSKNADTLRKHVKAGRIFIPLLVAVVLALVTGGIGKVAVAAASIAGLVTLEEGAMLACSLGTGAVVGATSYISGETTLQFLKKFDGENSEQKVSSILPNLRLNELHEYVKDKNPTEEGIKQIIIKICPNKSRDQVDKEVRAMSNEEKQYIYSLIENQNKIKQRLSLFQYKQNDNQPRVSNSFSNSFSNS